MRHWIIDREVALLPSWLEALPQAKLIQRDVIVDLPRGEQAIYWCRLRHGETVSSIFPPIQLEAGQFVVVLADEPDETIVTESLASGASGCCNTYAAPDVLKQVALVVQNGGLWIGQSLLQRVIGSAAAILGRRPQDQEIENWSSQLSEREAQVARLVAVGASNKEVARQLSITERTVKAHLTAVFEKLGLRDRLQLSLRVNGLST
ncbi:MAG: response regulator transcription factor [Dechloromonas sp.]|nr:response regulator transcription factor [Dechloromonas sp.]